MKEEVAKETADIYAACQEFITVVDARSYEAHDEAVSHLVSAMKTVPDWIIRP